MAKYIHKMSIHFYFYEYFQHHRYTRYICPNEQHHTHPPQYLLINLIFISKKKKGINGLQRCSVKLHEEKKAKEVKKEFTDILLQRLIEYLLGRLKNKPHQVAAHSAAPDKSAKRMCQSVNRFSNSPLMYP